MNFHPSLLIFESAYAALIQFESKVVCFDVITEKLNPTEIKSTKTKLNIRYKYLLEIKTINNDCPMFQFITIFKNSLDSPYHRDACSVAYLAFS